MSFVEFLLEYYIYILVILILLIVTVIGFIVDSKNKEKMKNNSVVDSNNNASAVQNSQVPVQDGQASVSNVSEVQSQNVSTSNEVALEEKNTSLEQLSDVKNDGVISNVGMTDNNQVSVDNGMNSLQSDQQVGQSQDVNSMSFQSMNINNQNMVNDMNAVTNNQVMENSPVIETNVEPMQSEQLVQNVDPIQSEQILQNMQPIENISNPQPIDVMSNAQPIGNAQVIPPIQGEPMVNNQSGANIPNVGINTQPVMNNTMAVNNVPVNSVDMVNGMVSTLGVSNGNTMTGVNAGQLDMLNPMSIETVNAMSNSNVGSGIVGAVPSNQVSSQNTSMMGINYNNVSANNMVNGMMGTQSVQQPVNMGMVNNTYQANGVNMSGNTVMGPTSNISNSSGVVTTNGAQPFDINSMFANNQ